jgi:hypothetical protein
MYVQRNTEAPSSIHCCSGKVISITYLECVSVALVFQHTMRMRQIVICGLSGSTTVFHIISYMAPFSKKKGGVIEHKMCFDFIYKSFLKHFSF